MAVNEEQVQKTDDVIDELRKLYAEAPDKYKEAIREKILETWSRFDNIIVCACGEKFETDVEATAYYVDSVILLKKDVKIDLTKGYALNKWTTHVSHLKREIDSNHKWSEA